MIRGERRLPLGTAVTDFSSLGAKKNHHFHNRRKKLVDITTGRKNFPRNYRGRGAVRSGHGWLSTLHLSLIVARAEFDVLSYTSFNLAQFHDHHLFFHPTPSIHLSLKIMSVISYSVPA